MLRSRSLILVCCLALLLPLTIRTGLSADSSSDAADANLDRITSSMVIQGLKRPVWLRLSCFQCEKPWKERAEESQSSYLKALFSFLDADGSGSLSRGEVGQLAAPRNQRPVANGIEVFVAFNFRVLDTDGNGTVSPAELESYLSSQGETATQFSTIVTDATSDALFRELDLDGDRMLSQSEMSQVERLFERDRDGNQVITLEELQGRPMGRSPPEFFAAAPGHLAPKGTLLIRHDDEFAKALSPDACVDVHIDFPDPGPGPGKAGLRASDDGSRIGISSSRRPADLPIVTVKINQQAEELGLRIEQSADHSLVLACGQRRIVLRCLNPASIQLANVRLSLQQEFDSLSGPVGATASVPASADMSPALKSTFPVADRNGNDELDETELQRYLNQLAAAQLDAGRGRLRGVVFAEQAGLMPIVDVNRDGRLSRRELQAIPKAVKPFQDENGKLPGHNLPLTTLIILQRGPFPLNDDKNPLLNVGPNWFSKADRNADGDLDRDEFPGSPEDFARLDGNRDGWIDVDEAIAGDNESKGVSP